MVLPKSGGCSPSDLYAYDSVHIMPDAVGGSKSYMTDALHVTQPTASKHWTVMKQLTARKY